MSPFELALLVGVVVVALVSWRNRRAWTWIAVGVADYILTSFYYEAAPYWLPHTIVTCAIDGIVVALLAIYGLHRWETWFRRCFQASMLASIAALLAAGHVNPNDLAYTYALALEVCNWAALLVVGANGALETADARLDMGCFWNGTVRRARVRLGEARPRTTLLARITGSGEKA